MLPGSGPMRERNSDRMCAWREKLGHNLIGSYKSLDFIPCEAESFLRVFSEHHFSIHFFKDFANYYVDHRCRKAKIEMERSKRL